MSGVNNLSISSSSGQDLTAVAKAAGTDQAQIASAAGVDEMTGTSLKYEEMITNGTLFTDTNHDGLADNFTAPTGTPTIANGCQKVTESAGAASLSHAAATQEGIAYVLELEYKSDKAMHADVGSVQLDIAASALEFTTSRHEFVSPGAAAVVLSLIAPAAGESFTVKKLSLLPANVNQLSVGLEL
jgi:hypothetical protein